MEHAASAPLFSRRAGVLAPVSSLPGPVSCGDFGAASLRFLDWCAAAGLTVWQVLPLGPLGAGNSPYASSSVFALSPLWYADDAVATNDSAKVDYVRAARLKSRRLEEQCLRFQRDPGEDERLAFEAWVESPDRSWLDEWALYAALKEHYGGRGWIEWDAELRRREPAALREARTRFAERMRFHAWVQFAIDTQALAVRRAAEQRGVVWFGDLPFYVALDSADVWSRRELFRVDENGVPEAIAGVPPDTFSEVGQRWNHPLFDWDAMAEDGYVWWIDRCRASLRRLHALRLDHFRGYRAFWEIPATADNAVNGRWVEGPGEALFDSLREAGLMSRLIAEDLGEITKDVLQLRDDYGLPGMHVLQFGLHDEHSTHHPANHAQHALACTGTHDNDTFQGWYASLDEPAHGRVAAQLNAAVSPSIAGVELAWASPAVWALAPLQDLLELGSEARMNLPGRADGQWIWRCATDQLERGRAARLLDLAHRYGRA